MPSHANVQNVENSHKQVMKKNSKDNHLHNPQKQTGSDLSHKQLSPLLKKKQTSIVDNTKDIEASTLPSKNSIVNKNKPNNFIKEQQDKKTDAMKKRKEKLKNDNEALNRILGYRDQLQKYGFSHSLPEKYHFVTSKYPNADVPPSTNQEGNIRNIDYLSVDLHDNTESRVNNARKNNKSLKDYLKIFNVETEEMIKPARDIKTAQALKMVNDKNLNNGNIPVAGVKIKPEKPKKINKNAKKVYTSTELKRLTARAGIIEINEHNQTGARDGGVFLGNKSFTNIQASLSPDDLFKGIKLLDIPNTVSTGYYSSDAEINRALAASKDHPGRIFRPVSQLPHYRVEDIEEFLDEIALAYKKSEAGIELHPEIRKRIRRHVIKENYILSTGAGIAGTHAEVQALNYLFTELDKSHEEFAELQRSNTSLTEEENEEIIRLDKANAKHLRQAYIVTHRLFDSPTVLAGQAFVACANCTGILNGMETIVTGIVNKNIRIIRSLSVK
ncbi:YwqJ-related putative deaminase [Rouxiella sp. T17]|uniref:YwqJ-related putative deaminase n=1 Tax=Rouxiella sp. T17 TaxID=3085684 RepID=UPI002FC7EE61